MAMGVACVAMVDAVASGVVYTRDPLRPDETDVLVHSIFGLGQYLVDGTLTPDLLPGVARRRIGPGLHRGPQARPPRPRAGRHGRAEERCPSRSRSPRPWTRSAPRDPGGATRPASRSTTGPRRTSSGPSTGRVASSCSRPAPCASSVPPPAPTLSTSRGFAPLRTGGTTVCCGAGAGPVCQVRGRRGPRPGRRRGGRRLGAALPRPGHGDGQGERDRDRGRRGGQPHGHPGPGVPACPRWPGSSGATEIPDGERVTVDATGGIGLRGRAPGAGRGPAPGARAVRGHRHLRAAGEGAGQGRPAEPSPPRRPGVPPGGVPHAARHHPLRPPEGDGGDVLRGPGGRPPAPVRAPARDAPSPSRSG